jgi:hypothetical protein
VEETVRILVALLFGLTLCGTAVAAQVADVDTGPTRWPETLGLEAPTDDFTVSLPTDSFSFPSVDRSSGLKRFAVGAAIGGALGFAVFTAADGSEGAYFGLAFGVPIGGLIGGLFHLAVGS